MKSSSKYCLIGKKYDLAKRGSYTVTKRFCVEHNLNFKVDTEIPNLEELTTKFKVISTFQAPELYAFHYNVIKARRLNMIFYIRNSVNKFLQRPITNGLSMYNSNNFFNAFIPMITNFSVDSKPTEPVVGFYARVHTNPDAIEYLRYELDQLTKPISLVTMGNATTYLTHPMIKQHYHTHDAVDFFNHITHYYFPKSAMFIDPFPNALLEALQCGKQIICPTLPARNHVDGIDDILSCVSNYHTTLSDVYSDKCYATTTGLTSENFSIFYQHLLDQDWCYDMRPSATLYDWCVNHL
jgi:hypothetical protein